MVDPTKKTYEGLKRNKATGDLSVSVFFVFCATILVGQSSPLQRANGYTY